MSRAQALYGVVVAFLVVSVATGTFAELSSSSRAMACCANAQNQCTGVKSPDDCCKGMGHGLAAAAVATVTALKAHASGAGVGAVFATITITSQPRWSAAAAGSNFKRPHDPPHLRAIPLLI